jgi:hypothetical protein
VCPLDRGPGNTLLLLAARIQPTKYMSLVRDGAHLELLIGLFVAVLSATASAQSSGRAVHPGRQTLEFRARRADSAGHPDEAKRIRARLEQGDFLVGDRVVAAYEGRGLGRTDTLVVQANRILRLGDPLGDLDLYGVLLFELEDSLSARLGKYYRNATVHVKPLLRLAISGTVRSPGFYYAAADMPLGDVIMRSGGSDPASDFGNIVVRRGTEVVWPRDQVQTAIREGRTVASLSLEPGDEIVVGARSPSR